MSLRRAQRALLALVIAVLLLGGTPATITQSYDIAAGRPRRRDQAQVTEAVSEVKRGLSQTFEGGAGI